MKRLSRTWSGWRCEMGRPRTTNLDLPTHLRLRRGTFFFVQPGTGRFINLGKDRAAAEINLRELLAGPLDLSRVPYAGSDRVHFLRFTDMVYRRTRARALQKGMEFSLTDQHVVDLFVASNGRCAVSGIEFDDMEVGKRGLRPWMPSLDRIMAREGYAPGNVRVVCVAANIALSDFGDEVLIRLARAIAERSISSTDQKSQSIAARQINDLHASK